MAASDVISTMPMAKLRLRNTRKSTSGCSAVNSRTRNPMNESTEMVASQQIQHDLQRRQPERQQAEAEEIDVRLLVALDVGRVLDQPFLQGHREHAHRQV